MQHAKVGGGGEGWIYLFEIDTHDIYSIFKCKNNRELMNIVIFTTTTTTTQELDASLSDQ